MIKTGVHKFMKLSLTRTMSYESSLSLRKMYPNCSEKLETIDEINHDTKNKFSGVIPMDKIQFEYSGMNLNDHIMNQDPTFVSLSFNVKSADWLNSLTKENLLKKQHKIITKDGFLILRSNLTNSKLLNQAALLEKLRNMIRLAEKNTNGNVNN